MYAALTLDFYGTLVEEDSEIVARIARDVARASPLAPTAAEVGRTWSRRFAELCAAAAGDGFRSQRALERASLPVCLVSNIDSDDLRAALRSLGWSFASIVTSESARAYKPRPEPFRAALRALGSSPEQTLHAGDSARSDVAGAAALGMPVAWLNPSGRALPEPLRASGAQVLRGLADLAALV